MAIGETRNFSAKGPANSVKRLIVGFRLHPDLRDKGFAVELHEGVVGRRGGFENPRLAVGKGIVPRRHHQFARHQHARGIKIGLPFNALLCWLDRQTTIGGAALSNSEACARSRLKHSRCSRQCPTSCATVKR